MEDPNELMDVFIEITKKEYDEFLNRRYHPVRFLGPDVEAIQQNGQYFYAFNNYDEVYASPQKKSHKIVAERIESLIEALERTDIHPTLITICRSVFSGFTPRDQYDFIEKSLLDGLRKIYSVNTHHISELLEDELVAKF